MVDGWPAAHFGVGPHPTHIKPEVYPKVEDEATILVLLPQSAGDHSSLLELAV